MPYKTKLPTGIEVWADSWEEHLRHLMLAEQMMVPRARAEAGKRALFVADLEAERAELRAQRENFADAERQQATLAEFVRSINSNQRSALRLIRAKRRVTLDELTAGLQQEGNQATGGVMAGMTKLAETFGIKLGDLFTKATEPGTPDPRKSVTVYRVGPGLAALTERDLSEPAKEARR